MLSNLAGGNMFIKARGLNGVCTEWCEGRAEGRGRAVAHTSTGRAVDTQALSREGRGRAVAHTSTL